MKKQKQTKKAGSSRKAPKTPATAQATKPPRTRERDPRLPAAGTVLKREYKGKEYRVTVLEEGFRCDGKDYRSLSALAADLTGAKSINGFLWMNLVERKTATPPTTPKASKSKGKRPAPKEDAPETAAPAGEAATA